MTHSKGRGEVGGKERRTRKPQTPGTPSSPHHPPSQPAHALSTPNVPSMPPTTPETLNNSPPPPSSLPGGLTPLSLLVNTLNTVLYSPIHAACPAHCNLSHPPPGPCGDPRKPVALFSTKEKMSMVRLIDARGEERKPFRPSSAVDERNTSVSNSNLNRVLSTNPDWTKMNDAQRERIGLTFDEEGEFWMPLEDFVSLFTELTLCRLLNINMFSLSQSWSEAVVRGAWSTGEHGSSEDRSGGCSSAFSGTFLRNPQFLLDVGVDGDELLIQLLQGSSDREQQSVAVQSLLIGFSIIKVEENRKYRLHKLWDHTPVLVVCDPIRRRQIYYRGPIAQGRYILVPTAHKPGDEGPFLLRIFSSTDTKLRNIKRDMPKPPIFWCLWSAPLWITVVHIKSAEELKSERFRCKSRLQNLKTVELLMSLHDIMTSTDDFVILGLRTDNMLWGMFLSLSCLEHYPVTGTSQGITVSVSALNPYCTIKCEGEKARTPVDHNTKDPHWDSSFVFYRKKTDKPIEIKVTVRGVFNHKALLWDQFLGQVQLPATLNHQPTLLRVQLMDKSTTSGHGGLLLQLMTDDNLSAV
uniref:Uncharacterized protein n=1 Tax=Timema genevievae TaxID=629358 RepID=A0A7R9JWK0_TIMGE|nr:unnamed protein product [Timema genevievae]